MMSFYKIKRGVLDSEVFEKDPFTEREAWIWMIGEAAWKDHYKPIAGKRVEIKRGQFSHSLRFMAERFQWSKNKVKRYMDKLALWDMIRYSNVTGQNILTICNYSQYQGRWDNSVTEIGTASETPSGQHRDKKEEIQERKNNNIKKINKKNTDRPSEVSEDIWNDFIAQRKTPFTQTAFKLLSNEAEKAGWELERAMQESVLRGWQSFKADWVKKQENRDERLDRAAERAFEELTGEAERRDQTALLPSTTEF